MREGNLRKTGFSSEKRNDRFEGKLNRASGVFWQARNKTLYWGCFIIT